MTFIAVPSFLGWFTCSLFTCLSASTLAPAVVPRRFGLVKPSRSSNRYREYSDEEVTLLRFVKAQMEQGATIGSLAAEGHDSLVARMRVATPVSPEEQKPHERLFRRFGGVAGPT